MADKAEKVVGDVSQWGLVPSFWAYSKLFIQQVLALKPVQAIPGAFTTSMNNNPRAINRVEICGVVVGQAQNSAAVTYEVDDGTGVVGCVVWRNENNGDKDPAMLANLGDTVTVVSYQWLLLVVVTCNLHLYMNMNAL
eukprot:m.136050 g.136050  ORF g.136050 m.136050 type:complete len:138 (-) comp14722_c0_seq4:7338-7751(-)